MAICVYHNPDFPEFYHGESPQTPDLRRLYLAAIVATNEPEIAYRFTQHLGMDWFDHPNVTTVVHSRSTSAGDVLETEDGRLLLVAPFGFIELPDAPLPAARSPLIQALHSFAANENQARMQDRLARKAHHLYSALLFAASVLEMVTHKDEARTNADQGLLIRFAAEQAHWALAQADRG